MCLAHKNDPTSSYQKLVTDFNSKTLSVTNVKNSYLTAETLSLFFWRNLIIVYLLILTTWVLELKSVANKQLESASRCVRTAFESFKNSSQKMRSILIQHTYTHTHKFITLHSNIYYLASSWSNSYRP
ncbi:hypothetical protein BpHYR1_013845 [Brachionus plicatilis]|uniref:Uncharacterized protein n=1 Tax=Brachionus plicatilis TaxID=10195 RepID=A0A3M7QD18_BRAPC|nr:hypothetical protein BpHYR1_013845 [Brachionus plicatilis]